MRLLRALPAAAAAVALLAGCTAAVQQAAAGRSTAPGGPVTAVSAVKPCDLPGGMRAGPAPGAALNGPAVTDLSGGAVTGGFALDGGKFSIVPPSAGDVPRVSRTLADYYEVFIIDAATGGDAVTYDEAAPDQCAGPGVSVPSVSIPVELTSVRWKLDSRGPRNAYDTLTAYVPPCLDYDKQVTLGFDSNLVTVLAYGQVAASCEPPRPVTVRLEIGSDSNPGWPRPLNLGHAATGLYLTGSGEGLLP
jgi:hypothetical protein